MANFAQLTSNSGFWGSHMSTLMPWGPFIKIQHFDFSYSWTFFWSWSHCALATLVDRKTSLDLTIPY